MLASELVAFLLPTKPGLIRAMNSPFEREVFPMQRALEWQRAGKAEVVGGVLIFFDEFQQSVHRTMRSDSEQREADRRFEAMVDLEHSGGETTTEAHAVWHSKKSGGIKTRQMRRVWPRGTFKDDDAARG